MAQRIIRPSLAPLTTIARSTLLALSLCTAAAAEPALKRDAFVERVLSHGLQARLAEAEAQVQLAELAGAGTWPNPTVQWQREALPGSGAGAGSQDFFLLGVPFVPSGRLGLERDAAALFTQAAEVRLNRARAELRREATVAFARLVAARDRRAALEQSLEKVRSLTRIIQAREKAGEAAGMERIRMEVEAAALQDALRGAHLEELQSRAAAVALLGPGAPSPVEVAGALVQPVALGDMERLVAQLNERRADLLALSLEARSAERAERAAARSWIPEPSVTAGALLDDLGGAGSSTGYVVGVSVPLPFFDHRQGDVARARARGALAKTRHAALLHRAILSAQAARETAGLSRQRLERHEAEVLQRALALRESAYAAYQGGSAELLVLVDAERTLREALLHRVELGLEVVQAEADLLLVTGAWDSLAAGSQQP